MTPPPPGRAAPDRGQAARPGPETLPRGGSMDATGPRQAPKNGNADAPTAQKGGSLFGGALEDAVLDSSRSVLRKHRGGGATVGLPLA